MPTTRVRARVTTTHHVEAYGGFQFGPGIMEEIAGAIQSGQMPMNFQHDVTRPVNPVNVVAGTEIMDDGHIAVWTEFDVDTELWESYQREVDEADAPGGFSISITAPIFESSSEMAVAADASHFDEETIVLAASDLGALGDVGPAWLFQFSYVPEAKVLFDLLVNTVNTLGPNIVASALYDAAKRFLRRPGSGATTFNLTWRESARGDRSLQVKISVEDPQVLKEAMERLPDILSELGGKTYVYDSAADRYIDVPATPDVPALAV